MLSKRSGKTAVLTQVPQFFIVLGRKLSLIKAKFPAVFYAKFPKRQQGKVPAHSLCVASEQSEQYLKPPLSPEEVNSR